MDNVASAGAKPIRIAPLLTAGTLNWIRLFIALALAIGAQMILLQTSADNNDEAMMLAVASGMQIISAVVFGTPLHRRAALKVIPRLELPRSHVSRPALNWRRRWSLGLLGVSIALAGLAIGLFASNGENTAVVLLWLAGMFALVIAQIQSIRLTLPRIPPDERLYLLGLGILLVVGLISRSYQLTTLPYNLDGDFAAVGLQARELATGQQNHIFAYGWASVPMLGYLPPWLTMSLFDADLAALNLSGLIEGLLIVGGVYLLGRDLFHARVGLFAAALLTVSYTHLAASRQSSYIDPVFFLVFAIYFLLIGLREGRGWAIVVSGFLTALCVQMYYSGRLVVFVVAFMLLYLLLFRRAWLFGRWWTIVLWVIAVLIALGPMLVAFVWESDQFVVRTREVFILTPSVVEHMQSVYNVDNMPAVLLEQTRRSLLMFNYFLDTSTQYALLVPFLDPLNAMLFFLGIGYALFRWRWLGYTTMLAWAVLGTIIGCLLTVNPPFWPRLLILLPATALLAAIALDQLYQHTKYGLARIAKPAALIAPVATVLLLIGTGITNWNTYVDAKGTYATPRTRIGRYLADQPPSTLAYLVSADFSFGDREMELLAPGRLVANLTQEQAAGEISPLGEHTLLILTWEQSALFEQLEQEYGTESVETIIGNSPEEVAFYVVRLPEN